MNPRTRRDNSPCCPTVNGDRKAPVKQGETESSWRPERETDSTTLRCWRRILIQTSREATESGSAAALAYTSSVLVDPLQVTKSLQENIKQFRERQKKNRYGLNMKGARHIRPI